MGRGDLPEYTVTVADNNPGLLVQGSLGSGAVPDLEPSSELEPGVQGKVTGVEAEAAAEARAATAAAGKVEPAVGTVAAVGVELVVGPAVAAASGREPEAR